MGERIRVTEKQLSSAITVWLKRVPKDVWARLIEQKVLAFYKRDSGLFNLDAELAAHISSEMTRLDWQARTLSRRTMERRQNAIQPRPRPDDS